MPPTLCRSPAGCLAGFEEGKGFGFAALLFGLGGGFPSVVLSYASGVSQTDAVAAETIVLIGRHWG
ncbi:MAG: hypothetical protein N3E46_05670 [Gemmataceae bacterium]|uniref:Uncharacterized protein n=1 Tax=Thermogemmata fonticola TaxID=2755323 RepID=A0A7V8VEB9_9BACT|nr:hypothetical protein [Thermogemmata fonticola]MBA2226427.1 hypothetical protein [Thermogemmata fonticola]MCX8139151.1 hypothetical protein [Gemmataceae bacterium]